MVRRSRLSSPISRWHALLLFMYWSGTAICNVVGVDTMTQASSRAGSLATLHLIPLLFTNRLSFAADLLGLSLQTYLSLYTSMGLMALVQSLIHTVIFFTHNPINLREDLQLYGFIVRSRISQRAFNIFTNCERALLLSPRWYRSPYFERRFLKFVRKCTMLLLYWSPIWYSDIRPCVRHHLDSTSLSPDVFSAFPLSFGIQD